MAGKIDGELPIDPVYTARFKKNKDKFIRCQPGPYGLPPYRKYHHPCFHKKDLRYNGDRKHESARTSANSESKITHLSESIHDGASIIL